MELTSKLIDLFDNSEGLLKLVLGFQNNLQNRLDDWSKDKEIVQEVRKLISESERLKNLLQSIIENEVEADQDIVGLQNDFVKLLLRAESLTALFMSKSISLERSL